MNEIVNTQTLLFIKAIQIGMLLASLYDLVRIARKMVKHPNWLVQLEDMLYWISCMFISFGVLYMHNFANIRFFALMGMLLGAILYFATLSILFMKVATYIIDLVKEVFSYLMKVLSVPIGWLIRLLGIPVTLARHKWVQVTYLSHKKAKQVKRKWYYIKADTRAGIATRKNKSIYTKRKID